MLSQTKKLAILFADISGSTALYDNLGDELARHLVARSLNILGDCIAAYQGRQVKTIGDEIMCSFPGAAFALQAAQKMQLAIRDDNRGNEHPLHIRIGFHYGLVICEADEIYGDTVNIAARVTAITRANQIMTTKAVVDALPQEYHDKIREIFRSNLRGKQEQLEVFQVVWESEDMQSTRIGIPAYRKQQEDDMGMILVYRDQSCTINGRNNSVIMGREDACIIIVKSNFASRQHAVLELRSGNYVLQDDSTNGTYICFSNGNIVYINHEEEILSGTGTISLGRAYSDGPTELIAFSIPNKVESEV